jgi:hypothetical protein
MPSQLNEAARRIAMTSRFLSATFVVVSLHVSAQSLYGHWLYPGYQSVVTASGFWSYHPTLMPILRWGARPDEPCVSKQLYPLRSLSFEVTCGHWDELNNQRWGLGRIEDISRTVFKDAFHSP